MKKLVLLSILCLLMGSVQAKKVKFAVNMGTNTISTLGIHVMGDFQTIAGFSGGDFNAATTLCNQQGTTTIYSVIVDLPAFQKYEFKFVNGDQSYEAEFVPEKARVGYNFDDNRWIYVDSLSNDTSSIGDVMFGGTSPAGLTLVRFIVDMQNETVSSNGVHVAGNFQGTDPAKTRLYSFGNNIYEIIAYTNLSSLQFKYYNGKIAANTETVPGSCATSGNRTHAASADSILTTICFSSCNACIPSGIKTTVIEANTLKLYPNPACSMVTVSTPVKGEIIVTNITGKIIHTQNTLDEETNMNLSQFAGGFYQVYYKTNSFTHHSKLIIEN
jgi:hypothetical protein